MGIYKVNSNGSAPQGLQVGDYVVTGGGTYLITGFFQDGSYQSQKVDGNQTTYNYKGTYDEVKKDDSVRKLTEDYTALLKQTAAPAYAGVSRSGGGELSAGVKQVQDNTMSFADAVALAKNALTPQYQETYRKSAENAAQRLEQAGLYDTVYGQALAAEAERDVSEQLNGAIGQLALELTRASAEDAQNILKILVDDSQFSAKQDADQKATTLNYLLQLLKLKQAE